MMSRQLMNYLPLGELAQRATGPGLDRRRAGEVLEERILQEHLSWSGLDQQSRSLVLRALSQEDKA